MSGSATGTGNIFEFNNHYYQVVEQARVHAALLLAMRLIISTMELRAI